MQAEKYTGIKRPTDLFHAKAQRRKENPAYLCGLLLRLCAFA